MVARKIFCMEHAGPGVGGTPRGRHSLCEQRDNLPSHLLRTHKYQPAHLLSLNGTPSPPPPNGGPCWRLGKGLSHCSPFEDGAGGLDGVVTPFTFCLRHTTPFPPACTGGSSTTRFGRSTPMHPGTCRIMGPVLSFARIGVMIFLFSLPLLPCWTLPHQSICGLGPAGRGHQRFLLSVNSVVN